jgi:lysozyme
VGHEGIALSKYKDSVGVWTVGIGATVSEISDIASWPLSKTITIQEAFDLLAKGIVKYENELNKYITKQIPQYQFDALVSWCYNVGVGWVKKASVIKLINQGASAGQLYDALMLYRSPPEVIGRRTKEARLLAYGAYSNGGKATLFPVSSKGFPMYAKGTEINVWEHIAVSSEVAPLVPIVAKADEKAVAVKPSSGTTLTNLVSTISSLLGFSQ